MSLSLKIVLTLMASIFGLGTTSAWATELPSSENPATGNWTYMRSTSFAPTIASAMEQCERTAMTDTSGRLTLSKCDHFKRLLQSNQCQVVMVKDGIVYDRMNGRVDNKSTVTQNVKKTLGREDRALLCDLGEQVYAYWFVGVAHQSCNNVGFVFAQRPVPVAGECGSNARNYSSTETEWPAGGTFCKAGEQSQAGIEFPNHGSNTLWTCLGLKGGNSAACTASREKKLVVLPKDMMTKKVCVLVPVLLGVTNIPPSTVSISGRLNQTCIGPQWLPGLQVTSGGGTAQTFGYYEHCETVVVE
jgi:hypothetical protein